MGGLMHPFGEPARTVLNAAAAPRMMEQYIGYMLALPAPRWWRNRDEREYRVYLASFLSA